jgi:general secretion pathway protein D
MKSMWTKPALAWTLAMTIAWGQQPPPIVVPPGFGPQVQSTPQGQAAPAPAKPEPAQPAPAGQAPVRTAPSAAPTSAGGLNLTNASLTEVIDIFARMLKINYILDPRVKGSVVLNTYGESRQLDTRSLLDMILRINGFAMVQVGDIYRIVPLSEVARLPLTPQMNMTKKDIPESDQTILNLVFLKYATVDELAKLLEPFMGENSKVYAYAPANLLMIIDSARSMRRTMDLIGLFDNDTFAGSRVRLIEVKNSRPTDLAKELENIFKSIALNEKNAPLKFIPVDRINTIIAVAANPGAFEEVEKWVKKLDIAVKLTAGSIDNFVYRVKYGRAETLAGAITMLYGGYPMMGGMGGGMYGGGMMGGGGYGGGMMGGGGYGGGMMGGGGYGGYGGGGYGGYGGGGYGGGYGGGMYGGGAYPLPTSGAAIPYNTPPSVGPGGSTAVNPGTGTDQTGNYLGMGAMGGPGGVRIPRIIPNPMDNTLLIQGTTQEYEGIMKLLKDLDVSPRQVLIEARIYEVSLTNSMASGVAYYLQKKNAADSGNQSLSTRNVLGNLASGSLNLTAGALVGQSRELLAYLSAQEGTTRTKVVSAPSVIATDSIAASINVGTEVPTLSAQAVTGVQSGGSSLFAQNITNRNSGVTLSITARVNPSGIVTLLINQEVSSPEAPAAGGIQSPSFSKRSVQTQVTVQDGDTIAIGGIINESNASSSGGIPFLHRIPGIGGAFGNKSISKERTEMIVFMTPRVIYDTNDINEASDELKGRLKKLGKIVRED